MSTYLILVRFAQQGIQNIKDRPARVQQTKATFEAVGAHVKEFYALMRRDDTAFQSCAFNIWSLSQMQNIVSEWKYPHRKAFWIS